MEEIKSRAEANRPLLDFGIAAFTLPGQSESGDRHIIAPFNGGVLVAVVDGIGHGSEAAKVARVTEEILKNHPDEELTPLLKRCHEGLRGTRGVVMSLAVINYAQKVMTWAGVGNVQGSLISMDTLTPPRTLLVSMGTLGQLLGAVYPTQVALKSGDTLVLSTDGVRENFIENLYMKQTPQQLADEIMVRSVRHTDDALVLVGRCFF